MKNLTLFITIVTLSIFNSVGAITYVQPQNLKVVNMTDSSFTLLWDIPEEYADIINDNTLVINDGVTNVYIWGIGKDTRRYDFKGTYTEGANSVTISPETSYTLQVTTDPIQWDSPWGSFAKIENVTTPAVGISAKPAAPFNLVISDVTDNSFILTWENDINSTATGISIKDIDASGNELWVSEVGTGINTFTYTGTLTNWDGNGSVTVKAKTNYRVKLQAKPDNDYNAYSSYIDTITAISTSLNNITAPTKLSPNPTTGLVRIENAEVASIELYSLTGRQILRQNISPSSTIDISQLNAGTYILKTFSKEQNILSTDKVIKN